MCCPKFETELPNQTVVRISYSYITLQGFIKETDPVFCEDLVAAFSALHEVGLVRAKKVNRFTQCGKVGLVKPCTESPN